jgi:hypothetical protein
MWATMQTTNALYNESLSKVTIFMRRKSPRACGLHSWILDLAISYSSLQFFKEDCALDQPAPRPTTTTTVDKE